MYTPIDEYDYPLTLIDVKKYITPIHTKEIKAPLNLSTASFNNPPIINSFNTEPIKPMTRVKEKRKRNLFPEIYELNLSPKNLKKAYNKKYFQYIKQFK